MAVILAVAKPLLLILAAAGLGTGILRMAGVRPPRGQAPFHAAAMGLGALSLVLFALGLSGGIYAWVVWGLILSIAFLFAADAYDWTRALLKTLARFFAARTLFTRALLTVLLIALAANFASSLAPPTETDALTLHVLLPAQYAREHRMYYPGDNWDAAMAMGPHLLYSSVILGARRFPDVAPGVLHFFVSALTMLWVWAFARRLLGPATAYAAAAIFYVAPMMAHLASAPTADAFFALYSFAAFAGLMEFLRRSNARMLIAAGIFAGFSAGAKYSGLIVAAALTASALAAAALARKDMKRTVAACLAASLAALLVLAPWYLRNHAWTGNPVFPTQRRLFGTDGWDRPGWESPEDPRYGALGRSLPNMLLAPWRITTRARMTSGGISGAVSPAIIVLLPLALLLRSRRRTFLFIAVWCIVAFAAVYWTSPRPRSRYYLVVIPQASILAAAALVPLKTYSRAALALAKTVVLLSAAMGLAVGAAYSGALVTGVLGLETTDAFLSRTTDFHETYRWMDENLPEDAGVLVAATNDLYYCPRRAFRLGLDDAYTHVDSRGYFGLDESGGVEEALARFDTLGVTHLFAHADLLEGDSPSRPAAVLHDMLIGGHLVKIYDAEDTRGTRVPGGKPRAERVAVWAVDFGEGRAE